MIGTAHASPLDQQPIGGAVGGIPIRRLYYLDPNLVDHSGHYFNYCAQAIREVKRRGIPVSIYARRTCTVTCEGLQPAAVFSYDIFKEAGRDPQVWAIENFHALNQAFLADLCRIDTANFGPSDLLFFPTLNQNQLYGIALWLGRIPAERRPAVAVLLRYLTPEMDYVKARANREVLGLFFRYAAQAVVAAQPRTFFCADTREMCEAFQPLLGQPVIELPVALEPPPAGASSHRARGERPNVVYLGHASPLKGFHLLPEIIQQCGPLTPRPHFLIQAQNAGQGPLAPVTQWLVRQAAAGVRVVDGTLSPDAYYRLMAEADIILLPYSQSYYGHCSSGVFAEAAAQGKVIVVPSGTVAARQAREFELGAVVASAWTAAALAGAVAAAVRDWSQLHGRALAAAPRFRTAQSVETFWDRLLEVVPAAKTS